MADKWQDDWALVDEPVADADEFVTADVSDATANAYGTVKRKTRLNVIGSILGATTASFTTADETKLDGIEALADVTDATNVAAAGAHMAGGTDVPVTDGGTGASTAPGARTNLGLVIGTDVVPVNNPAFTGTVTVPDGALAIADTSGLQSALDLKAPLASPTFTGTVALPNDQISYAELQNVAALSVVGNATNATADPAEITAGSDGQVLRRSGTALGFGTVATAGIADAQVTYAKIQNVAGLSVVARSANTSGVAADVTAGTDGDVLRRSGTTLGFGAIPQASVTSLTADLALKAPLASPTFTGTVTVPAGSISYGEIQNVSATDRLLGRDTAAAGVIEELTVSGGLEFTGGPGIQRSALTGEVTAAAGSAATTIANDAVTYAKMQNISAASLLLGRGSAAGAGDPQEITLGTNLSMSGTTLNAASGAGVAAAGTPVDNQVAVWTTATVIEGTTGLTWDGTTLAATNVDINAGRLTIDADADTYMDSATDDLITFTVNAQALYQFREITGSGQLQIYSFDAGTGEGPFLELRRQGGSQADSDSLGVIRFNGQDDAGTPNSHTYATIRARVRDSGDTSEDGEINLRVSIAGTLTDRVIINEVGVELTGAITLPDASLAIADTSGLQAALDLKAPLASPTFTTALTAANPTFTGTVTIPDGALAIADTSGLQSALDLKAPLASPTFTGTVALPNDQISYAEMQNVAALSVVGNGTNAIADPADITAGTDGHVLRRSGTTLGFGTIPQASVTNLTTDLGLKAPLASPTFTTALTAANPTFTGTVTIPDNALAIADTSGLQTALDAKLPLAGGTLTGALTLGSGASIDGGGKVIAHNLQSIVTSVTGTLTITAHSGNTLVTSGNVTVPTTAGFYCTLIAGGAHTITFNSTVSAAMAAGDIVSLVVQSGTVIHAIKVLAANKVAFA